MRRREFITLLGGAAAWPLAARAQHAERVRLRISILGRFDLTAISRYFPEFEREMPRYFSQF